MRPLRPKPLVTLAQAGAEDRQRALEEVCRRALKGFVGREVTPYLLEEARLSMRDALDRAIQNGTYVLPDGLSLSHIDLGGDLRLKVYFSRTNPTIGRALRVADELELDDIDEKGPT